MNPNTSKQNSQDNPDQGAAMLGFATQIPMRAKAQGYSGFADITPGQAKANLGLVTHLQNHLLPPKGAEKPSSSTEAPKEAPKEAETPQEDTAEPAEEANPDVEALKSQVTEMDAKMKEMAKMLDTALQTSDKHRKDNEEFKKELKGIINGDNQGNTKKTAA